MYKYLFPLVFFCFFSDVSAQVRRPAQVIKSPSTVKKSINKDTVARTKPTPVGQIRNEKQFQEVCNELTLLLNQKQFSAFAMKVRKALLMFPGNKKILELKRQYVAEDYKVNILNAAVVSEDKFFEKKPVLSSCQPGIVNTIGHQHVLNRINYVRRLAGLYDSCVFDPQLNKKCQLAAMMMDANHTLDHAPKSNWKCYSKEGASAAGTSNLSLGYSFSDAIMGQMEDNGAGNSACGHRRWLLNPYNNVFGHGSTFNAMSLSVFGAGDPKLTKKTGFIDSQFVSWPSADFFPLDLVPERWSFSLDNADFSQAKVSFISDGKPFKVKIEPVKTGYGINTLVWVLDKPIEANKTYVITVSQVKLISGWGKNASGNMKSYTYQVMPITIK